MTTLLLPRTFAILAAAGVSALAVTPEKEKEFVESYRKAAESNDKAALASFLLTDGATKEALEFFGMLQAMDAGKKIASIELVTPTADEAAKLNQPMEMPDGRRYKMPFPPSKQLVVTIEENTKERVGKSTSKIAVGEKNGKLYVLVPVPVN